jgi:hypothetical protein
MKNRANRSGVFIAALLAAAFLFLQTGCRSAQDLPGQWLTLPTSADGRLDDFSRKITSHLFENGMMVGLGNDDSNLYVFFTPDFRHGQRLPGRAILTLWLDAQGGKARKLALVHVSEPAASTPPPEPGMSKGNAPSIAGPAAAGKRELLKVIDRGRGTEIFIPADGSLGPAVRLASDWGDFAYQLRIPFQGAGDWPGMAVGPGRDIGIELQWQVKPLAPRERNRDQGRRGRPGSDDPGMGPPPGMEGDGPGPGRGLPGETPANKRTVRVKTRLAVK